MASRRAILVKKRPMYVETYIYQARTAAAETERQRNRKTAIVTITTDTVKIIVTMAVFLFESNHYYG